MKAAVLHGDFDMRYEDWEEPQVKAGHVKVKVCACGVCGSDAPRITKGMAHYYPIVLGHEFSGYVTEIGEGVTSLKVGDHVAGVPLIPCRKCRDCQNGNYSLCKNYTFIGSRIQGAFADYIVLPEDNAVKIDSNLPFEQGALFEPSTVALHGLKLTNYNGGKNVAVLGGGTIGQFTLQWAKIFGGANVVVFDIDDKKLDLCCRLGADKGINTLNEGFIEEAMKETDGRGFDYVFETAGSPITTKLAFTLAGNCADVCCIGTPSGDVSFTPREWEQLNRKELHVTGSWMSGGSPFPGDDWTMTAHFFATGQLKYDPEIFSCRIPLSQPEKIVEALKTCQNSKGRILVVNED